MMREGMAGLTESSDESIFGIEPESEGKSSRDGDVGSSPLCPQCRSNKVWRDGHRQSVFGDDIQRWLCRVCGLRFSDQNDIQKSWSMAEKSARIRGMALKSEADYPYPRQICVAETKNLATELQTDLLVVPQKEAYDTKDLKGAVVEFLYYLQKNEKAPSTKSHYLCCHLKLCRAQKLKEFCPHQGNSAVTHPRSFLTDPNNETIQKCQFYGMT